MHGAGRTAGKRTRPDRSNSSADITYQTVRMTKNIYYVNIEIYNIHLQSDVLQTCAWSRDLSQIQLRRTSISPTSVLLSYYH